MDDHLHVERSMAGLSDLELIDVIENHPGDYESFALEIARAELTRRKLAPAYRKQLREKAVATAEPPPSVVDAIGVRFGHHLLLLAGALFWPILLVLALGARRHGDHEHARRLRIAVWFGAIFWAAIAFRFIWSVCFDRR